MNWELGRGRTLKKSSQLSVEIVPVERMVEGGCQVGERKQWKCALGIWIFSTKIVQLYNRTEGSDIGYLSYLSPLVKLNHTSL
jgi:hypothetical protein